MENKEKPAMVDAVPRNHSTQAYIADWHVNRLSPNLAPPSTCHIAAPTEKQLILTKNDGKLHLPCLQSPSDGGRMLAKLAQ